MPNGILKRCTAGLLSAAVLASLSVGALPANAAYDMAPAASVSTVTNNAPDPLLAAQKDYIIAFDKMINAERAGKGLAPLKFNATIASDAVNWSKSMDTVGYRHTNSTEQAKESFAAWQTGRGENIMASSKTIPSVTDHYNAWKNSAPHYAAMMNATYTSYGIGAMSTTKGGTYGNYSTTIFRTSPGNGILPQTYASAEAYFSGQAPLSTTVVRPVAPSFNIANRTYTLPAVTGVTYYVNNKVVAPGTHTLPREGYVSVMAYAASGYHLTSETSSWAQSYEAQEVPPVTPKAPTFNPTNRTYTIPVSAGVTYQVNGKDVTAGVKTISDSAQYVDITANAQEGYALSGEVYWSHYYTAKESSATTVQAAAPTFNISDRTYTVPSKQGVTYKINGQPASAGVRGVVEEDQYVNITAHATAGYVLTGITSWTSFYPAVVPSVEIVQPTAPTFSTTARTYVVPAKAGVTYRVNGTTFRAGTYSVGTAATRIAITAHASEGYSLTGTSTWAKDYAAKPVTSVVATAPTFNATARTYVIPAKAGVIYKVNGLPVPAATHIVPNAATTVKVTAHADAGYSLSGTSSWSNAYVAKVTSATASAPTFNTTARTYFIPTKTGVTYKVNGVTKKAGTYAVGTAAATIKVTAHANTGYKLSGTASWSKAYAVKPAVAVTASAPSFSTTGRTYTIPTKAGVTYKVGGVTKKAGKYTVGTSATTVKVTAHANTGYKLSGTTSWSKYYAAAITVKPSVPSFSVSGRTYTIPTKTGVTYKVNGVTKKAGKYGVGTAATTVKVTAHANTGYKLSGTASWSKAYAKKATVTVTASAPSFSVSGRTYTIPTKTGVTYKVNGVTKKAGRHGVGTAATTVKVTAHANSGYKLSGTVSWSKYYAKKK